MALTHIIDQVIRPIAFQVKISTERDGRLVEAPLGTAFATSDAGHIASNWALDKGAERLIGDVTANPGNSGGPSTLLKVAESLACAWPVNSRMF